MTRGSDSIHRNREAIAAPTSRILTASLRNLKLDSLILGGRHEDFHSVNSRARKQKPRETICERNRERMWVWWVKPREIWSCESGREAAHIHTRKNKTICSCPSVKVLRRD